MRYDGRATASCIPKINIFIVNNGLLEEADDTSKGFAVDRDEIERASGGDSHRRDRLVTEAFGGIWWFEKYKEYYIS